MKIRELLDVIVEKHPYAESINKKLLIECENLPCPNSYKTNVKAKMTEWRLKSSNIDLITSFVINLIKNNSTSWLFPTKDWRLTVEESWFAKYSKDEYTISHDHVPMDFSYVYFIKSPKGSSPLVFSTTGRKIKPNEGTVVIFPSIMKHHVPPNKCEDRIVLAGNLYLKNVS